MNIDEIVNSLAGCPCGRPHTSRLRRVEIGSAITEHAADILESCAFPKKLLCVADKNTLAACGNLPDVLERRGFTLIWRRYDDLRVAQVGECIAVAENAALEGALGILSIGSGSLNDICRRAALLADLPFAIYATAPSMDGFASGTSPLTDGNFKMTYPARQPDVIIADTKVLAAAPAELKSAGAGDIFAKYIALCDWRISHILTGEYYCENIAEITRGALRRVASLADSVTGDSEEAAGAIMEALVLTGIAMKLADSVRPASGAEHVISHFWEIKKLERGIISDFHGKKVGVATLICSKAYHDTASSRFDIRPDMPDWDKIYAVYGPNFTDDVKKLNSPTVTGETSVDKIAENEDEIKRIIREEVPSPETLDSLMRRAGCARTLDDIAVGHELGLDGVKYHAYMRHRMTLMRLLPMLRGEVDFESFII
ncbi:MAG: iron-containing alcohol dehydrogenase [Eubacteriales bacterium]